MCGTGSDSKAIDDVSVQVCGVQGSFEALPAKSYKECGHRSVMVRKKWCRMRSEEVGMSNEGD